MYVIIPIIIRDTTSDIAAKAIKTRVIESIIPPDNFVNVAAKSVYIIESSTAFPSFHEFK